jgi:hypothetical protein
MTDVTIYFSNPLIYLIIWIFLLSLAEEKLDVVYFLIVSAIGLPFGVYILTTTSGTYDVFLGTAILLISVYTSFLAIIYGFKIQSFMKKKE